MNRLRAFFLAVLCCGLMGFAGIELEQIYERQQILAATQNKLAANQLRIDEFNRHIVDLNERFRVNAENIKAASSAPQTADEPASTEPEKRRERLGALTAETEVLTAESKALGKEITALRADIAETMPHPGAQPQFIWSYRLLWPFAGFGVFLCVLILASWKSARVKRRIEARNAELRLRGIDPLRLSDDVKQLAQSGRKIAAIKAYRGETGVGLAQAKEAVEKYLDQ